MEYAAMTVKIVTDAGSDITPEDASQLGITVVPTYVRFGDKVYRDGIDIGVDEFYRKLDGGTVYPSTAALSPGEFAGTYEAALRETDQIVSIHITRKHSAVYDAALLGRDMVQKKDCRIEVIDSRGVAIWQGLIVIAAAKAARAGCNLQQVVDVVKEAIGQIRGLALLSTLRYAVKGGRLSNTIFAVESLLNVKPMVTIRDGEVVPAGIARTWNRGMERLYKFIKSITSIEEISVAHGNLPDEAQKLADYITSLFPGIVPRMTRLGPTLGSHAGPGTVLVVVHEKTNINR
jgi:DegV family protein with EDD domain